MNCGAPITRGSFCWGIVNNCYPLTVTDHASRFLLTCEALSSTREDYAFTVFERLFQERGLPANIRSDNGGALRFRSRSVQPEQTRGLVAQAGHRHRTDQTGPPAAKRPP